MTDDERNNVQIQIACTIDDVYFEENKQTNKYQFSSVDASQEFVKKMKTLKKDSRFCQIVARQ